MLNKVVLIGRLTKDIELKRTSSNTSYANFSIAVNRPFKSGDGERGVDFINCVVWRRLAEVVANYTSKGSQIAVEGRIQARSYDNAEGKKVYVTEVVAENIQFLDSKKDSKVSSSVTPSDFEEPEAPPAEKSDPFADFGESIEISDDELPF